MKKLFIIAALCILAIAAVQHFGQSDVYYTIQANYYAGTPPAPYFPLAGAEADYRMDFEGQGYGDWDNGETEFDGRREIQVEEQCVWWETYSECTNYDFVSPTDGQNEDIPGNLNGSAHWFIPSE